MFTLQFICISLNRNWNLYNLNKQLAECQRLKGRADHFQTSLNDTLQWKMGFEISFSIHESEFEKKVKQLEVDLRITADMKLQLPNEAS